MSSEGAPPADADVPESVWSTVHPRFGARPDWRTAVVRKRWPLGVALLFGLGLVGSIALLTVSQFAARTGFVNTLEAELLELSVVQQLFLVVLFAPVVEELIFRLPLSERPRWGVLAATGAIGALNFAGSSGPVVAVAAVFALIAVVSVALWAQSLVARTVRAHTEPVPRSPAWRDGVARWWAAHPRWPIWCSVAAFGLVHLSNYDVTWTVVTVAVAPLVVSPQIWLGLMFTIARVRYGWWAGLVLHACHNLAVWSVSSALS